VKTVAANQQAAQLAGGAGVQADGAGVWRVRAQRARGRAKGRLLKRGCQDGGHDGRANQRGNARNGAAVGADEHLAHAASVGAYCGAHVGAARRAVQAQPADAGACAAQQRKLQGQHARRARLERRRQRRRGACPAEDKPSRRAATHNHAADDKGIFKYRRRKYLIRDNCNANHFCRMSVRLDGNATNVVETPFIPSQKKLTDFISQNIGISLFKKDERGYVQNELFVAGTLLKATKLVSNRWDVQFSEIVPWYKYNPNGCFWHLAYETSEFTIDLHSMDRIEVISEDAKIASQLNQIHSHFKNDQEIVQYSRAKMWQTRALRFKYLQDKAVLFEELEQELTLLKTIASDDAPNQYAQVINTADALARFLQEISHERPSIFKWRKARSWLTNAWEKYQKAEKTVATFDDNQPDTIADFIRIGRNVAHAVDSLLLETAHLRFNLLLNTLETQVSLLFNEHELSKLDV
jgi:hypothetical protein